MLNKKIPLLGMKTKKLPLWLLILLLTSGAALTLGLLSFGGIFAIAPIMGFAISAFVLSIVYEAEIYKQNLTGAFNKFTKYNYLKRFMAQKMLLELAKVCDEEQEQKRSHDDWEFIKDYRLQLRRVKAYHDKILSKEDQLASKAAEKKLRHMEKWFAEVVFRVQRQENETAYEKELLDALAPEIKTLKEGYSRNRIAHFSAIGVGVVAAGVSMLGTVFLLADVLPLIPLVASLAMPMTLPIVLAAIVAGSAYGLLIYNAMTDFFNNETYKKLWEGSAWNKALGVGLIIMALALSIATAGTWWTLTKHSGPALTWLGKNAPSLARFLIKIPSKIIIGLHVVVMGFAALCFNIENTGESKASLLEFLHGVRDKLSHFSPKAIAGLGVRLLHWLTSKPAGENLIQAWNLPRIAIRVVFAPLKTVFFLFHLASMAVTADRFPGIPQIATAFFGFVCEGMEDLHYFFSHGHHHHHEEESNDDFNAFIDERLEGANGHDHGNDIPSKLLRAATWLFKPFELSWDLFFSQFNKPANKLSFKQAFKKAYGFKVPFTKTPPEEIDQVTLPDEQVSSTGEKHLLAHKIDTYNRKHFGSSTELMQASLTPQKSLNLRQAKQLALKDLSHDVKHSDRELTPQEALNEARTRQKYKKGDTNYTVSELLNKHRLTSQSEKDTASSEFIKTISQAA